MFACICDAHRAGSVECDGSKCSDNDKGKSDIAWQKGNSILWLENKIRYMVADALEREKSILYQFGAYLPHR